jgi:hypothetical protein
VAKSPSFVLRNRLQKEAELTDWFLSRTTRKISTEQIISPPMRSSLKQSSLFTSRPLPTSTFINTHNLGHCKDSPHLVLT